MTARSMQFCSSRTFPGHAYCRISSTALGAKISGFLFKSRQKRSRKYLASIGMSSGRSRSGGIVIGNTDKRKYRSPRYCRAATAAFRFRFVAATTRTSTCRSAVPPTRSKLFSSSARRIFACSESGRSPISSRNSVPRCASSNLPALRCDAPVKASFSCPKSSVSSSVSGMGARAVQLDGHLFQRGVPADDLRRAASGGELLLEQDVLGGHAALDERAFHHQQQMIGVDRLGEEIERAFLHPRHPVLN